MTKPTGGSFIFQGVGTTSMPNATVCGAVNQFVVVGIALLGANDPFSVQWCDIGDPSNWSTPGSDAARTNQAGLQVLNPRHGKVTGIAGNDFFGYVFQQRAITKMTYVGGDVVFTFDTFEEGRGCVEYERLVQIDDLVIFQSEFGYHALQDGLITDIGHGFVDDSYVPIVNLDQDDVVVNPAIHTVFFGDNDVAYNYKTGQWTRVPAFNGNEYYSIDSANGVIGQVVFSGSTVDFQDSSGGAATTATVVTGEFDLGGQRVVVNGCRPLTDGGSLSSISIGVRDVLTDSVTKATGTAINSRTGMSNFRGGANTPEGRYLRGEFVFTGGFTTVSGAEFEFTPSGKV